MNEITNPLRLAVGSHAAGSGKGCAMNVISWENGDSTITDFPGCADGFLARVVQRVNDSYCTHRNGGDLLCPPCSLEVLALGHRTVGTALLGWSNEDRKRVYVQIAVHEAESVLHLVRDNGEAAACIDLTKRWVAGESITREQLMEARSKAYADAAYAYADAADAAYAAAAAAYADAADAAYAAAAAAYAAAAAAYADAADAERARLRLARAHKIIDRFEEITGVRSTPVTQETTAVAVAHMLEVSR